MRGVFSLFGHNLPTFRPGQPMPTKRLNAAVEAIERARPIVGPNSGLDVVQLPNGFASRVVGGGGIAIFRLSTSASAASGATYSADGRGVLQYDNGSALADATTATTVLKNEHTKGVTAGSTVFVKAALVGGSWWIFDVSDCSKYV